MIGEGIDSYGRIHVLIVLGRIANLCLMKSILLLNN
jgi:hypothetical protein